MYEMDERSILSTTKYVAAMKKKFLVSEICTYLDNNPGVEDVYSVIKPHLAELNLLASEKGNDYELSVTAPAKPFIHNDDATSHLKSFLQSPALPEDFERIINDFIVKKTGKTVGRRAHAGEDPTAVREQKAGVLERGQFPEYEYRKGTVSCIPCYRPGIYPAFDISSRCHVDGLLQRDMRILDAGTGPGVVPLGIIDFYRRFPGNTAEIFAIEQSDEFIEAYGAMAIPYNDLVPGVHIHHPLQGDIGTTDLSHSMVLNVVYKTSSMKLRIFPHGLKSSVNTPDFLVKMD